MTPDNAGQNVLADLDRLGAKAAHGRVCSEDSYPEDRAARAYAALAANHLRPLLAALLARGCQYGWAWIGCANVSPEEACDTCSALAALQRHIAKALEE
jgi:hypothetical protein